MRTVTRSLAAATVLWVLAPAHVASAKVTAKPDGRTHGPAADGAAATSA
jgi:hypothetical protein